MHSVEANMDNKHVKIHKASANALTFYGCDYRHPRSLQAGLHKEPATSLSTSRHLVFRPASKMHIHITSIAVIHIRRSGKLIHTYTHTNTYFTKITKHRRDVSETETQQNLKRRQRTLDHWELRPVILQPHSPGFETPL